MAAQTEMQAQIVLRQIASATKHFSRLYQVARCSSYARIQGQTIALHSFELKTDPMVLRASFGSASIIG